MAAILAAAAAIGASLAIPASAAAAAAAPKLTIHALSVPNDFSEADNAACEPTAEDFIAWESCDGFQVTATNSGAAPTTGPIVLSDRLPAGLKVVGAALFFARNQSRLSERESPEGERIEGLGEGCEAKESPTIVTCEYGGALPPDDRLIMDVHVVVEPGAASAPGEAALTESAVTLASSSADDVVTASTARPPFGVAGLVSEITEPDGTSDTQAGGHPYEFLTRIDANTKMGQTPETNLRQPTGSGGEIRDVVVDLPLGFLGSAQAAGTCTFAQLQSHEQCPADSLVGHLSTAPGAHEVAANSPLWNMVPEHGYAAQFGFVDLLFNTHVIDASVAPTPSGYVLRAIAKEIPDIQLWSTVATLYGDPARRNAETRQQQQEKEILEKTGAEVKLPLEETANPQAQFTNPSDCNGRPLETTVHLDSWEHPGTFNADGTPDVEGEGWTAPFTVDSPPVTGCNALRFDPSAFSFTPETQTADAPTGASFDLQVPQPEGPDTLATPPLKDASVTLPPGLTLDPSSAGGLQACSEAQIGWLGPVSAENLGYSHFTEAAPTCPEASKIGSVELTTPLVAGTLKGSVYLAAENENPYNALYGGYIVIDDEKTGTIVKIPGKIETNETTGQVTGVFDDNPQFPFSDLKIHFFGGERGDLATPEACGTYTTNANFEPWSHTEAGGGEATPDATPSSSFNITGGCVSAFTPAFSAGTTSPQGGSFSPFVLSLSKQDDEQGLAGLTVNLPPGLVGRITGVAECSDAQVAAAEARSAPGQGAAELASPSCPESSLLGTVTTATGPGSEPFGVTGKAYLTGPYKGAPYGMAVIVPAIAGPFDLGVVVIRQALYINPTTAQVTDVSDPFPTILDGIPLRIQRIKVNLDREGFTLNPTSCDVKAITATATSTQGAQTPLSARYQAAGCQGLPFHPEFTVSTQGNGTTKGHGASLDVKIGYPQPYTSYANILKVDTSLPLALSSRLTTLQKACTETQFAVNPAGCPPASDVGTATASTPLLPNPMTGPAYLVSHGGRAFPDLDIILQGNNVTIDLTGNTDIKGGITYSKFETVPDAPVSSFELNLPEKENSILGAVKNLCAPTKTVTVKKKVTVKRHGKRVKVTKKVTKTEPEPLIMPTTMTGQNGAVLQQNIKVAVTGCKATKSAKKATKKKKKGHGKGKK